MAKAEQAPTDYILLRLQTFDDQTVDRPNPVEAWVPVMNQTTAEGVDGQPRIFSARGKQAAIRQHTGDGPDVVEGTWRAIPVSSWKGGLTTKRVVAAERLPLEDL